MSTPSGDDPYPAAVTRLLNLVEQHGFTFTPAGENGSLRGERVTARWRDLMFPGVSGDRNTARASTSALTPGERLFTERITGTAPTVLHTVVYGWPDT